MTAKKKYSINFSYVRQNAAIFGAYNGVLETVKLGFGDVHVLPLTAK